MNNKQSSLLLDGLVIFASLVLIGLSAAWMLSSGMLNINLAEDSKLSWHLVRSSGIVAYGLLLASMVWGVLMSGQFVKNWSPGPVSMTVHSTVSWLAVILGLVHALLLMFDSYFSYTLGDLFIPFTGPYRPEVVGLGTLAFWIGLLVSISFWFKKRIGHKTWKYVHYASYLSFAMVSAHGIFSGTEGENLGFRLLVGGGLALVTVLLMMRISKASAQPAAKARALQNAP